MIDNLGHECSVVLVQSTDGTPVASDTVSLMERSRHRGETSFGIARISPRQNIEIVTRKDLANLCQPSVTGHPSTTSLGHCRYKTSGRDRRNERQPFKFKLNGIQYAFGFNGNIANFDDLDHRFDGVQPHVDTAVIQQLLIQGLQQHTRDDMAAVMHHLEENLDGAFSLGIMDSTGQPYGYRNRYGFRPLVYAETNNRHVLASEDSAIWGHYGPAVKSMQHIAPGQLVNMNTGELTRVADAEMARCFFEWVYFANIESSLDDVKVRDLREALGHRLADNDADMDGRHQIVMPVPFSAMRQGFCYADRRRTRLGHRNVSYQEGGIIRNEPKPNRPQRSFTHGDDRFAVADEKLSVDPNLNIQDKEIVVIDDSMVRSTTMQALIRKLRAKSPKAIHLRLACPPIVGLCYYGIDISQLDELVARKYLDADGSLKPEWEAQLAKDLGVDSVRFLGVEDMLECFEKVGVPRATLCQACVRGQPEAYPTPTGQARFRQALSVIQE